MKIIYKILTVLIVLALLFVLFLFLNKKPMNNFTNQEKQTNQEGFAEKWELLVKSKTSVEEKTNAQAVQEFAADNYVLYSFVLEDFLTLEQISVNDLLKVGNKKLTVKMSVDNKNFSSWHPIDNQNIFMLMRE